MNSTAFDDASLIAQAVSAHAVAPRRRLRAGGQKLVLLVDRRGSDAVLKIVRVDPAATDDALKRAHREAQLLADMSHPHIVKGLTPAVELGQPVYAICWLEEFLNGDDLRDIVGTPWPWPETARMARDIADALDALHRSQIVHRDLSAGNVRRLTTGEYKLLDPGFARHLNLSGLTGFHQPGTPGFISPEHVQFGTAPSYASDAFSLGVLMWLTLTGNLPLSPTDPVAYVHALSAKQLPSILAHRPDLRPEEAAVVDRCLQRQIARRFFDGAEIRTALDVL